MAKSYDAVIVGARCAGNPTAIRLAERGWSVLLVDRDPPPADTVSTHFMFPNTLSRLRELGVLRRIEEQHTLNPMMHRVRILGHEVAGPFTPVDGFDRSRGITRPVLDKALLDAAVDAGAEVRFGERVTGLLGAGSEEEPVRGVRLEGGDEIEARWVIGADGRASTVAKLLGLERERPLAGDIGFIYSYWRGVPRNEHLHIEALESLVLTWGNCEDDVSILVVGGPDEFTRGSAEERQRRLVAGLSEFPTSFDPRWLQGAEQIAEVRVAPETMMRGFFRRAAGPGWALVGDAGHFKHPATAQGISDAIEQGLRLAEALAEDEDLGGFEEWREARSAEHYDWSFNFGMTPRPEVAGPLFGGLAADEQAGREFLDIHTRLKRPRSDVFTKERLARWFS